MRCAWSIVALSIVGIGGCRTTTTPVTPQPGLTRAPSANSSRSDANFRPTGATWSSNVSAGVLPLGTIPYDNSSLPVTSPDGRFIATQVGARPTITTELARPGAEVPYATAVEIYRLDPETRQPNLVVEVGEGLILGRSSSNLGVLVEAPQEDGSRWIGLASWQTGTISWLVRDEAVNAFASMGPGGRLAWSRRSPDSEYFDLVVQQGEREWVQPGNGADWLMPYWSGRGDGLFAIHLKSGDLDVVHGKASSQRAFRQSTDRLPLASNANDNSAYQTMAAPITVTDVPPPDYEVLMLFHSGRGRAIAWMPLARTAQEVVEFPRESVTALAVDANRALVTTYDDLIIQSLEQSRNRINLVKGTVIPRATPTGDWSYVLLAPGEGRIGLTAMSLLE